MALSEKLAEKLACPNCHGSLIYNRELNRLECHSCRMTFRIENDIPVLVADEAGKLE